MGAWLARLLFAPFKPLFDWSDRRCAETVTEALSDAQQAPDFIETSQPSGLSNKEGEVDGKQSGVHPRRTREAAEGPDGRGLHVGPGVLDCSGSDPQRELTHGAGRGLTPGAAQSGDRTPAEPPDEYDRQELLTERILDAANSRAREVGREDVALWEFEYQTRERTR